MNYSTGFYPSDTPINETTPEFPEGVSIFGPQYYLWKGEVDIISLRYEVVDSLSIVLTDEINNPVSGYKLNLYRGNQLYGPKMNNFKNHPIATKETNQNGQVTINFVPKGEYTVEVLDKNGNFITNLTADAKKPVNVLKTNITHFPATVLSLLSTSIVLIVVGLYIYNKHNNE